MMKSSRTLSTLSLAALAVSLTGIAGPAAQAAAPRVIKITGTEDMRFSVTRIEAEPGEALKVVLTSKGSQPKETMAHNFVLLARDVDVSTFINQAAMARANEYIPVSFRAKILAATKMAGAGETVETTFNAPTEPGSYAFVCTFPAHYAVGMKGTLIVKPAAAAPKKQ
jgi:azurin